MFKRTFDFVFAVLGLILFFPFMLLIAIWIKTDSRGPVIFRQERVGRNGKPFRIFKFRTMRNREEDNGLLVTRAADTRITTCGRILRKFKLDELPQLINVVLGQMSIVGPRPEVTKYVAVYPENIRKKILSVRPGITDNAAIAYRDEGSLLEAVADPEKEYVEVILPKKLSLYEAYVDNQSLAGDFILILRTIAAIFRVP